MTEVYDPVTRTVVADGGAYAKVGNHYEVPNCLPLAGPQVNGRYTLREDKKPHISVICTQQGTAGIQTAYFKEV